MLPDKFARFLFEFHAFRFESLELPPLPADHSDFDVHGSLEHDKVKTKNIAIYMYYMYNAIYFMYYCLISIIAIILEMIF